MEWIELGELSEVISGYAFKSKKYVNEGIRIIRITNVQNGYLVDENPKYYTEEDMIGLEQYLLSKDDILISLTGNVGRVARMKERFLPAALNQRVACIRPRDGILDDYLYYIANSLYFEDECINQSKGVAQKNLGITNLKKIKIPVPSLAIQEQIVEVLDRAQELIDKRKAQLDAMDSLIESIFYSMFGDPVRNEKGWEVKKLGDVAEINPKKSEVSNIKDTDMEVSFIPMTDVGENGKLNLKETREISEVYKGYTYFRENDILFAKITPCMENGKSCIVEDLINRIGFGSTEFHVIRVSSILKKEYVFNLIRTKIFKKEAESKMTGSAGQKRVPTTFIKEYSIQIPPLDLQNEFAQKVELIEREKEALEESLELMEENYRSIMDRAFKGELFN